jgi:hypothetical protein
MYHTYIKIKSLKLFKKIFNFDGIPADLKTPFLLGKIIKKN